MKLTTEQVIILMRLYQHDTEGVFDPREMDPLIDDLLVGLDDRAEYKLTRKGRKHAEAMFSLDTSALADSKAQMEYVIGRMSNWKMKSAYNAALLIDEFPSAALKKLKKMSEDFGNCGWQEGKAYDRLRKVNTEIADLMGYDWSEEKDHFLRRGYDLDEERERSVKALKK